MAQKPSPNIKPKGKEEKIMANAKDFNYEVKKVIGQLGENSKYELRVVSWGGREAKLDIRQWYKQDGVEKGGKGVALGNEEAKTLIELLTAYLNDDDDDF